MDDNWSYWSNHFITYENIDSLWCTTETNIILYTNYSSIKKYKSIKHKFDQSFFSKPAQKEDWLKSKKKTWCKHQMIKLWKLYQVKQFKWKTCPQLGLLVSSYHSDILVKLTFLTAIDTGSRFPDLKPIVSRLNYLSLMDENNWKLLICVA